MNIQKIVVAAIVATQIMTYSPQTKSMLVSKGIVTTDTITGLDWLDFTETINLSTNYVSSQFGVGGKFEGWRFAKQNDVIGLFNDAGGTGVYDGSHSAVSFNGAAKKLLDLMGVTRNENPNVYRMSTVHFSGDIVPELGGLLILEWLPDSHFDILEVRQIMFAIGGVEMGKARALVRAAVSVVPEPSTAQLVCLSLLAIAFLRATGSSRRHKDHAA